MGHDGQLQFSPFFKFFFILGVCNYYVLTLKNKYNVLIVFTLFCKTLGIRVRLGSGLVI